MYKERSREKVERLFGEIASTYDRNNAILSFGLFKRWNRALVHALPKGARLLDLCAGTGEIAYAHYKRMPAELILLDFCQEMLDVAKNKAVGTPTFICADAHKIPLEDESIETVSCAYGIRNLLDPVKCAHEVFRVLKPGGVWGILELTRPTNRLMGAMHQLHVRVGVPLLGRLFSPSKAAYSYLADSVQNFTEPKKLSQNLLGVGFSRVSVKPLFPGAATLIMLTK